MLGSDPRSGFSEPVLYFRFRQTGIGAAFDPDWNTWDTPTRATCKHSVVRFWLGAFAIGPGCRFISRAFSRSHRRSRLRPNRVRNGLAAGGEWIGTFSSARDRQRLRGFIRVGATTRRIIRALVGLNTANQWRCSAASREPPPVVERRRPRHRRWRGIAELKVRIHSPPAVSQANFRRLQDRRVPDRRGPCGDPERSKSPRRLVGRNGWLEISSHPSKSHRARCGCLRRGL